MQESLIRNPSAPPENPRKRRWFTGFKILRLVETERWRSRASVNEGGSYVSRSLALRRQRSQVRILSGAPIFSRSYAKHAALLGRCGYHVATRSAGPSARRRRRGEKRTPFVRLICASRCARDGLNTV